MVKREQLLSISLDRTEALPEFWPDGNLLLLQRFLSSHRPMLIEKMDGSHISTTLIDGDFIYRSFTVSGCQDLLSRICRSLYTPV